MPGESALLARTETFTGQPSHTSLYRDFYFHEHRSADKPEYTAFSHFPVPRLLFPRTPFDSSADKPEYTAFSHFPVPRPLPGTAQSQLAPPTPHTRTRLRSLTCPLSGPSHPPTQVPRMSLVRSLAPAWSGPSHTPIQVACRHFAPARL